MRGAARRVSARAARSAGRADEADRPRSRAASRSSGFDIGLAGYDEPRGRDFEARALDAVRQLPGVDAAAAYADTLPLNIDQSSTTRRARRSAGPRAAGDESVARYRVSPEFSGRSASRLAAGPRDQPARRRRRARAWPSSMRRSRRKVLRTTNAVGRRFRYGWSGDWTEVVGLVEDGKYLSLNEAPRAAVFEAIVQHYSVDGHSGRSRSSLSARRRGAGAARDDRAARSAAAAVRNAESRVRCSVSCCCRAGWRRWRSARSACSRCLLALTGLYGVVTNAVARRRARSASASRSARGRRR